VTVPSRRTVACRLWSGSGVVARRAAGGAAAWVARGRRADIRGLRAVLGSLVRAGVLLGGAYAAVRTVRAAPAVLWPLSGVWCVLAYRAGAAPPPPAGPAAGGPQGPEGEPREAFARWLLTTIGDRRGVHLVELYPAMRALPGQQDRGDAALRAALRALGVPVVRSLRVGGVAGRSGVRRADVAGLLPRRVAGPVDAGGDAGQAQDSPLLSTVGEWVESA
jgi:hypothetical protein